MAGAMGHHSPDPRQGPTRQRSGTIVAAQGGQSAQGRGPQRPFLCAARRRCAGEECDADQPRAQP
eukprot:721471-Heterocapsa_arctica.AAC.1